MKFHIRRDSIVGAIFLLIAASAFAADDETILDKVLKFSGGQYMFSDTYGLRPFVGRLNTPKLDSDFNKQYEWQAINEKQRWEYGIGFVVKF